MEINLLKYNRHWEKGFRYPFAKKRNIFFSLIETINKRQIVEIVGLRRTGKTTLLFQLINYLLESGIEPFSILYFTFDEERIKIEDLIKIFSFWFVFLFYKEEDTGKFSRQNFKFQYSAP